jgi:beta-galactosidase
MMRIGDDANIAVERTNNGIVVSHNAMVSGRFNKYMWPDRLLSFEKEKKISGSFTIVPLTTIWPAGLQKIFGKSNQVAVPFAPFYHSYDQ